MSLIGKIQALFSDKEQTQPIFPITKIKAVSNDDGKGLNAVLDDMTAHTRMVGAPHNLLDNSDFRNPVNQRGFTSKELGSAGYTIDRWTTYAGFAVNSGYITITVPSDRYNFYQYHPLGTIIPGKVYTAAAKYSDGTILCGSTTAVSGSRVSCCVDSITFLQIGSNMDGKDHFCISVGTGSVSLEWAALYEGEYTAETLPEYQPKGYAHELLECQRYYYRATTASLVGYAYSTSNAYVILDVPVTLRGSASLTISEDTAITLRGDNKKVTIPVADVSIYAKSTNQYRFKISNFSDTGISENAVLHVMMSGNVELSADL